MGGGGFDVMLKLTGFIAVQWIFARVFKKFGAPTILGQMIAGILLGPELADTVPYAVERYPGEPSILTLIGNMGVSLMIFESGMHLHFDKVAEVEVK